MPVLPLSDHAGCRRASLLPLLLFAAVVAAGVGLGAVGARSTTPGPLAPALSLPTLSGNPVSLASLRGRVVVVNFWATWCPPCRAELPALADFARGEGAAGDVLLSVNQTSTETSEEAVRAFAKKYGIVTDVLLDSTGAVARAWEVQAYPSTFVVDPKGRVSAKRTGAVDLAWLAAGWRLRVDPRPPDRICPAHRLHPQRQKGAPRADAERELRYDGFISRLSRQVRTDF